MKKTVAIMLTFFIALGHSQAYTAAELSATEKPLASKIIAIDPGHGGYDPGAVWGDIYEKDINLKIAMELKKHLECSGAKVILTRNGDYNYALVGMHGRNAKRYDLAERIKLVDSQNADLLLTIHVNSIKKQSYEGAEVFHHPSSGEGKKLALAIQQELRTIPGMRKRITKVSNCYMLRKTEMPAVLVEVGYLSNQHERNLLQDPTYLDFVTQKIVSGLIKYYTSPDELNQGRVQEITINMDYILRHLGHSVLPGHQSETGQCNCIIH